MPPQTSPSSSLPAGYTLDPPVSGLPAGYALDTPSPASGLAPAAGAPPSPETAAKTMTSGEGPIAQGLTSFENRLSDIPAGLWHLTKGLIPGTSENAQLNQEHNAEVNKPALTQAKDIGYAGLRLLNPVVTTEGSLPQNIGATAANIVPFLIDPAGGGITESPLAKLAAAAKPTSVAEAGKLFGPIESAAKSTPTETAAPRAIAEEAAKYGETGATAPKVISKYLARTAPSNRLGPESPIFYPEGRKFAENAGKLSVSENMSANPQMQRLVGKFANALDNANREAAVKIGMGNQYDAAMKTYATAAQRAQFIDRLKKLAVRGTVGALGLKELHNLATSGR